MQINYKNLVKILKENDCYFLRQGKGSHEIWRSNINKKPFIVSKTIKAEGTWCAVLKQAGIKK
jgi:predicted RNA binding protein YcfA (HicA-like mRNA interferase family)